MVVTTTINGTEYELSTKLKVAYMVQGCHNHKPYLEIFQDVAKMTLERQIEILFVAFQVANPEVAMTFNQKAFLNYYLENYNLKTVMSQLQSVIKGITGEDEAPEEQNDQSNIEGNL